MADAANGSHGRSSANRERAVSSNRLPPIRLGANPRNTAATSRVESAVKLPRSNRSAITGPRTATPIAQAATAARPASASVRSIRRRASGRRRRLRRRAISGSSEFEIGLTRNVSGTPMQRMQYSSEAAVPGPT